MPAKRLSMRKIKDVLRLCWGQGLSKRKAAGSCGVSRPTVDDYLRRAEAAGLSWPLPAALDNGALERLLFPPPPALPDTARGGARLVRGASGTETPGRHPAAIVARVSPDSPARLSVHLVLPAVPGLGRQAGPGHAPGASGR